MADVSVPGLPEEFPDPDAPWIGPSKDDEPGAVYVRDADGNVTPVEPQTRRAWAQMRSRRRGRCSKR